MHRALFLEEILHVIFGYCYPEFRLAFLTDRGYHATDLVALASTCRVFKEPALDVLWTELKDTAPLARCLPGLCLLKSSKSRHPVYTFKRRLKETEREIVKRYTRRVCVLTVHWPSLDLESLEDLCLPSIADPLFPSIRQLSFSLTDQTIPLTHHIASPELKQICLDFSWSMSSPCENFVKSLGSGCPNVKMIEIPLLSMLPSPLGDIMIRNIRGWTDLQEVNCSKVGLDVNTLLHLSHMPQLTALSFMLSHELTDEVASSTHLFVFPALKSLRILVKSIVPVSKLFARMQLPAVNFTSIFFHNMPPPKHIIWSFLMALQGACNGQLGMHLSISYVDSIFIQNSGHSVLSPEDLHHFTALNLSCIHINLDWTVELKDSDLLEIASTCPRLTALIINDDHGWRAVGITPTGVAQFLRQCLFLHDLCIAIDTRGYTSPPQTQTCDGHFITRILRMNVVDSFIETDSVPALATFFADTFPLLANDLFSFRSWGSFTLRRSRRDSDVYLRRWQDVYTLAKQKLLERSREPSAGVIESWD